MGGSPVSMDLGVTYKFRYEAIAADKPKFTWLHQFFRNYRVSPDAFNGGALRNALRDCANESASGLNPVQMATNPASFVTPVKSCLIEKFPELDIKEISLLSPPRLPENIQASINRAFQAQQNAQSAKATAEKAKAEALANAAKASGEAQVRIIEAEADAKANDLLEQSINDSLIQWERLQVEKARNERWNGQYAPTIQTQNVQLGQSVQDEKR